MQIKYNIKKNKYDSEQEHKRIQSIFDMLIKSGFYNTRSGRVILHFNSGAYLQRIDVENTIVYNNT